MARIGGTTLLLAVVVFAYLAIFRSPGPILQSAAMLSSADESIALARAALDSTAEEINELSSDYDEEVANYLEQVLAYLSAARATLQEDFNQLTNKRSELSTEMFQIMVSLFAIFGIFLTLAVGVGSWIVKSEILDSVDEEIESQLKDRIEFGTKYAQAVTYGQLAFTWWELYEDPYQEEGRDEGAPGVEKNIEKERKKRLLEHARNALSMAQRGLDCCAAGPFAKRIKEGVDEDAWRQEAGLLNHWVYHRTVELDLDEFDRDPVESLELRELIANANDLLVRAGDMRAQNFGGFWYNAYETVGFALAMHGRDEEVVRGKKLLKGLITGELRPGMKFDLPALDWRRGILKEHNERFDLRIDPRSI